MELSGPVVKTYRAAWYGKPTLPLKVARSRYDDDLLSWDVLARDTPTRWVPIAEFATWRQAWGWALAQALYVRVVQKVEIIRYGGFDADGERVEVTRA